MRVFKVRFHCFASILAQKYKSYAPQIDPVRISLEVHAGLLRFRVEVDVWDILPV